VEQSAGQTHCRCPFPTSLIRRKSFVHQKIGKLQPIMSNSKSSFFLRELFTEISARLTAMFPEFNG
jgi:hypothetical protein